MWWCMNSPGLSIFVQLLRSIWLLDFIVSEMFPSLPYVDELFSPFFMKNSTEQPDSHVIHSHKARYGLKL